MTTSCSSSHESRTKNNPHPYTKVEVGGMIDLMEIWLKTHIGHSDEQKVREAQAIIRKELEDKP